MPPRIGDEKFLYKTYRCEWVVEVYPVDQYDKRTNEEPFYEAVFPCHKSATKHFESVTETRTGSSPLRRFWKGNPPHEYYNVGVRYREKLI